jgi:hypothetical protein
VDTALKMALAYHRIRGDGARTRLIGREKGYHGVGFGGISVGGISPNRKMFGAMLPGVDHLPHTHNIEKNAYSKGQPEWGAHLADELENIVADRRFRGCPDTAAGLPGTRSGDLRQAWHPADIRRSHLWLWPHRRHLRRKSIRCHTRPDDPREGPDQWHGAHGRSAGEE